MIILSAGEEARFGDDRLCPYYLAARKVIGWLVMGFMFCGLGCYWPAGEERFSVGLDYGRGVYEETA